MLKVRRFKFALLDTAVIGNDVGAILPFSEEVKQLVALQHPNILQTHSAYEAFPPHSMGTSSFIEMF